MSEDKNSTGWSLGFGTIARLIRERGKSSAPKPQEESPAPTADAISQEGYLRVSISENQRLDFYSTICPTCMFSINGVLTGPLGKFSKEGAQGGRQVQVTVPVRLTNGEKATIKIVLHCPREVYSGGELKLIRAGQGIIPPQTRVLEFYYSRSKYDFRYVVELDSSIEVLGFTEVLDKRPLFNTVPPVVQMSAFLRAVTRKRRTILNVCDSLRSVASLEALECLEALHDVSEESGRISMDIPNGLRDALKVAGKVISEQVIGAFSLFIDIEVGKLTVDVIRSSEIISVGAVSGYLVASYLGLTGNEAFWRKVLAAPDLELEALVTEAKSARYKSIMDKISGKLDHRTPLEVLSQVALESGSQRVIAFADKLASRLKDGRLSINDQQLALLAVLSAVGRRYHANTVVALCLFVDVEVGFITEASLEQLSPTADIIETSTYAMLAVAGAFDVNLRGFVLEGATPQVLALGFPRLVELAGVGVLGGFKRRVEGTPVWHWIRTGKAAVKALNSSSIEFSNTVLGSFPVIDQLSEIDLSYIVSSGRDFVMVFQSDLDKSLLWRRLSDIPEDSFRTGVDPDGVRRNFSFIDGFSAYHFSRSIIGSITDVKDEALIGKDNVLGVYLDDRENRHYRFHKHVATADDLLAEPHAGLVFNHQVVNELDVSQLPGKIRELSQDALLGRANALSAEFKVLSWINNALWEVLTTTPQYKDFHSVPNIYSRLYKAIFEGANRQLLFSMLDERTVGIVANAMKTGCESLDLKAYSPLLEGDASNEQLVLIGLWLTYVICVDNLLDFEGYYKQVDEKQFRKLMLDRLTNMVTSRNDSSRLMAMNMAATFEESGDVIGRYAMQYLLISGLQDHDSKVGQAAANSLVRLCLVDKVPLPRMLNIIKLVREVAPERVIKKPVEVVKDTNSLNPNEVKTFERLVDEWAKYVRQDDAARFEALPFINSDGEVDQIRLRSFIEFVVSLNMASRDHGALPRRYFAIVRHRDLEQVRGALLESWRLMAQSQRKRLSDIIADSTSAEVFLDYRFFVEDNDLDLRNELGSSPYLGGESRPLTVYHFRPGEAVSPFRHLDSSFIKDVKEESKFFLELLKMYFESSEGQVRIIRLVSASGMRMEDIETHLPVFRTSRSIELRTAEVFQAHRFRFSPVVHEMAFSLEQVGSDPKDIDDLQALLALYSGQRWQRSKASVAAPATEVELPTPEDTEIIKAEEPSDEPANVVAEPETKAVAPDSKADVSNNQSDCCNSYPNCTCTEEGVCGLINQPSYAPLKQALTIEKLPEIASVIGRTFDTPPELDRQIENMLMMVLRRSTYDL